jgi:Protein of unknown function (DUF2637)
MTTSRQSLWAELGEDRLRGSVVGTSLICFACEVVSGHAIYGYGVRHDVPGPIAALVPAAFFGAVFVFTLLALHRAADGLDPFTEKMWVFTMLSGAIAVNIAFGGAQSSDPAALAYYAAPPLTSGIALHRLTKRMIECRKRRAGVAEEPEPLHAIRTWVTRTVKVEPDTTPQLPAPTAADLSKSDALTTAEPSETLSSDLVDGSLTRPPTGSEDAGRDELNSRPEPVRSADRRRPGGPQPVAVPSESSRSGKAAGLALAERMLADGASLAEVREALGVTDRTLRRWFPPGHPVRTGRAA